MKRAVFLDKDGTLIRNVPYNFRTDSIEFLDGVREGLSLLTKKGFMLIVVSNQSGIARGMGTHRQLQEVWEEMNRRISPYHANLQGFYYCPHHPEGSVPEYSIACSCRKPEPGLITRAARENGISLKDSWVVGDILNDAEAGNRSGCRTVLVDNGNETEWYVTQSRFPDYIADSFMDAASYIITSSDYMHVYP